MATEKGSDTIYERITKNGLGSHVEFDASRGALVIKQFDPEQSEKVLAKLGLHMIRAGIPATMPVFVNVAPTAGDVVLVSFGNLNNLITNNWHVDRDAET